MLKRLVVSYNINNYGFGAFGLSIFTEETLMTTAADLISTISSGLLDSRLLDICRDPARLDYERDRYKGALDSFINAFGDADVSVFSAPGRSEISGNHTDHQHGKVIACSINRDAVAIASYRDDNSVHVISGDSGELVIDLSDLDIDAEFYGTTISLIKGVLRGIKDRGYRIGGFNSYITSDVLIGAGLSSSAAFETVIGAVVNGLYNEQKISDVEIAQIGQYAENVFFGKPCGLMDQMACSVGSLVYIDFEDPEKPIIEKVDLDLDNYSLSLCITDTKGSHSDLTADYAAVPEEMCSVAEFCGKHYLRDVPEDEVIAKLSDIRNACGDRAVLRAMHFYEENRRVEKIVAAIRNEDKQSFLDGIRQSGDSSYKYLQNVYTTHDTEHQNVSVALCMSEKALAGGKGVCRVHGGGFAGTIQAFVDNGAVIGYKECMDRLFGEGSCSVLKIRKYGGIMVV